MYDVGDVIVCPHCGATLEVEESDIQFVNSSLDFPHIECPACGYMIPAF